MGGPSKTDLANQAAIGQQQLTLAQDETAQQKADRDRAQQLEQPAIDKNTKLASGDRNAALSAAMPTISKLSAGFEGARQSIFNSVPPGPARDKALADLEVNKAVTSSTAQAAAVDAAPDKLANLGAGVGAFSLQELGAALSGLQGAGAASDSIITGKNEAKANSLGFFSSLAQTAGGAAIGLKKSDRRLKTNLRRHSVALEMIAKIQWYDFDYTDGDKDQFGVVAQEIQYVVPSVVTEDDDGFLQVDYGELLVIARNGLEEIESLIAQRAV